ncbi:unnamed protein product [Rhizoctonia solani]|uniref:Uncharacterized protein n=1 Tax=Rhizoctonia solani TaxID=456999 RepID=A0A8H3A1G4_9AGAM|nr:unnamed protein product [Rhizoctonia solani]
MATSMNSNVPHTQALAQNNIRHRPIRAATGLIAESAANLVNIPGLKESIQAARGIVKALKPNVVQEPARNDILAQGLIDRLDEIVCFAQYAGADEVSPEYLEDLQEIRMAVIKLKNKPYGTKLTCQSEIGKELGEMKEEIINRSLLLSVEGGVYGLRAKAQVTELTQQLESATESIAMLQGELATIKLQLERQNCSVDQVYPCALFGNLIDLKFNFFLNTRE